MSKDKDKTNDTPLYWQDVENKVIDEETLKSEFTEGELQFDLGSVKKSRRNFLQIMGFSFATLPLASSCMRIPVKKALPYLKKHDDVVPGVANWYATSMDPGQGGALLVKTREGRPIKIEGNPLSPVTKGGTTAYEQASVLSVYDSSRYQSPRIGGTNADWDSVDKELKKRFEGALAAGKEVVLVTSTVRSPSTLKLIGEFQAKYPGFKHVVFEPFSMDSILKANDQTFSMAVYPRYRFDQADYVLGFSADFLGTWLNPVEFTKQYSARRDLVDNDKPLKHVHFESMMSLTGSNADHRFTVAPDEERALIINILGYLQRKTGRHYLPLGQRLPAANAGMVQKVSEELLAHEGKSLVVSGSQDVSVQVMVNAINDLLGNYGKTVTLYENRYFKGPDLGGLDELIKSINAGKVGGVLLYDVNPVYDYFAGEELAKAMKKLDFSASFATFPDETSEACSMVLPSNYFLESWNDYFVAPNVLTFQQPVIQPLYGTRMFQESLLSLLGKKDYHQYLKDSVQAEFFNKQDRYATFMGFWDHAVHDGFALVGSERSNTPTFNKEPVTRHFAFLSKRKPASDTTLICYEKVSMRRGRLINNPWLQEMPDPITKVTWENYALMNPNEAREKGLKTGSVIEINKGNKKMTLPIVSQPGVARGVLAVAIGYGRQVSGKVGKGVGANAFPFIEAEKGVLNGAVSGVTYKITEQEVTLAQTQTHHSMEGRKIVKEATYEEYLKNPRAGNEDKVKLISLWQDHKKTGQQWAMAIDLNKCTGCSGCIISCNAENNVPVVGKEEVANRREMHWLRIDRYYKGDEENPEVVHQPVMCQHCDNAPCETVCPVLATVQSSDGLNQQVYNRCVGTRYCANNCPYKVRRFNWFDYPHNDKNENMVLNPDVVVRSRGVMEKCSMCVQRIQEGKLEAKKDGRELKDGEIKLACQQSCPADAIVFGDLNDPSSKVSKLLKHPRNYRLLEEINIQPRVSYLTKIRNKG